MTSFNSDSQLDDYEKRDQLKRQLVQDLKPLMNVNSRLKLYRAIK